MNCRHRTPVSRSRRPRVSSEPGFLRQLGEARWEFRIPRELKSPNKTLWAHWRLKQAERQAWEQELLLAIAVYGGITVAAGAQRLRSLSVFVAPGVKERRRVVVTRLVPSSRNFIKDDDNLSYSLKHLCDAMKRVGLLYDDRREYLDAPRPTQAVSPDRVYTTVIEIQRLGVGPAARITPAAIDIAAQGGLL